MSNHTQEEWQIAEDDKSFIYAIGPNGCNKFWFSVCSAGPDRISNEEKTANARLIAAAPDLLAALIAINEYWDSGNFTRRENLWEPMRAAIAKATGAA